MKLHPATRNLALALFLTIPCALSAQIQLSTFASSVSLVGVHIPSTRDAAMGYAGVANGGTVQGIWTNPASIGFMTNELQTEFTFVSSVGDKNTPGSEYNNSGSISFLGAGYRLTDRISVAASRFNYTLPNPERVPYIGNTATDPDKLSESLFTGTASFAVTPNIVAGANVSFLNFLYDKGKYFRSVTADAGVIYERDMVLLHKPSLTNQRVRAGIAMHNINQQDITWNADNGDTETFGMGSQLRVGGAWYFTVPMEQLSKVDFVEENDRFVDVTVQLQGLKYFNFNKTYSGGVSVGTEALFAKMLALRLGYRYEKRKGDTDRFQDSHVLSLPYLRGFTYGLGAQVPVNEMTEGKFPFDVNVDLFKRGPFTWIKTNPVYTPVGFTSMSLRLNWLLP